MEHLKYPIGKFKKPDHITDAHLQKWLKDIESLPALMEEIVNPLTKNELNTPYRPGGWTVRQVIHHVPDSHVNAYIRFKWTLTEDNPTIKAYYEDRWAMLPDQKTPVEVSLHILKAIHTRWAILIHSLSAEQLKRTFFHPESQKTFSLEEMVGHYAWHGRHHLEHIRVALK